MNGDCVNTTASGNSGGTSGNGASFPRAVARYVLTSLAHLCWPQGSLEGNKNGGENGAPFNTQIMTVLFHFPIFTHLRGICPFSPQETFISSLRLSGHLERSTDDVTPVRAPAGATPAHDLGVKKLRIIWRGVRTVPKWRETPRQSIEWGRRVAGRGQEETSQVEVHIKEVV